MKKINVIKALSSRSLKTSSLACLVYLSGSAGVHAELPVAHPSIPWSSNVRITQQTDSLLRIGQNQGRSGNWILNWQSFNISEGSRVQFDQPSSSHIALNRIYQNSASRIFGSIDANGRIYLINQNGFTFGKNSSINVNSLVASSLALNMSDQDFIDNNKNIANLVNDGEAAFDINAFRYRVNQDGSLSPTTLTDPDSGVTMTGSDLDGITVEQGAEFTAQNGGNILMFAPDINNGGEIKTSSGQTILAAAKDRVYLTPSTDPALRGFLVEVETGGSVENLGKILSERGNITLAGIAINQKGVLEATSSINENGSIRLLARDGAELEDSTTVDGSATASQLILGVDVKFAKTPEGLSTVREKYFIAKNTGELTLHENSRIEVKVDESDETLVSDAQTVRNSRIELTGKEIRLKEGALIKAPGADVVIHATENPLVAAVGVEVLNNNDVATLRSRDKSKVVMEAGSRIDVSGTTNTSVAMERNQLEVQLTGNFLRDAPLQRESSLRNERVNVDIREGTPLGDISDLVEQGVQRGITERMSTGGNVQIISQGGALLEEGSEIDISGGAVNYESGYINTSRLVTTTGRVVHVADADPNQTYGGVFGKLTVTSDRWGKSAERSWGLFGGEGAGVTRFHNAYTEGKDAGGLTVFSHALIADHELQAGTVSSTLQREAGQQPSGGSYNLLLSGSSGAGIFHSVNIVKESQNQLLTEQAMDDFLNNTGPADWLVEIDDDQLSNSGISDFKLVTNGDVGLEQDVAVSLLSGGSFDVSARSASVNGDIRIHSGTVKMNTTSNIEVKGLIDVSGTWVNDSEFVDDRDLSKAINLDGGSINLSSSNGRLLLSESKLAANGGAWLSADGQLKQGNGGSISLEVDRIDLGTAGRIAADLQLGEMEAYAGGRGGSLSLTTNFINIANSFTDDREIGELQLMPSFFTEKGFSDYELVSNTGNLTVSSDTVITPSTQSLVFDNNFSRQASADSLLSVSRIENLPDAIRPVTNITLRTDLSADVQLGDGLIFNGAIEANSGANIVLSAARDLFFNGRIRANGGTVKLGLATESTSGLLTAYEADQAIWFNGEIDVTGTFIEDLGNDSGLQTGRVLDSGNISLHTERGHIYLSENSKLDISGKSFEVDLPSQAINNTVVAYQRENVSADTGSISLIAAEGIFIDKNASMNAGSSGVEGAAGGSLYVGLNSENRGFRSDNTSGTEVAQAREIHIQQGTDFSSAINSIQIGEDFDSSLIGEAWISVDQLQDAGFSRLVFQVDNNRVDASAAGVGAIEFHDSVNLAANQSLHLISPIIKANSSSSAQVNLSAPYIFMGSAINAQPHADSIVSDGNTVLNVQAGNNNQGLLELAGNIKLQGISNSQFNSEGDIRLRGIREDNNSKELTGSVESWGNMAFNADQLYATTLSEFDLSVSGAANGELNISSDSGGKGSPVLSAGSQLSLNAPIINQGGVVKAPQGQLSLNASQELNLLNGSVTSVSAEDQLVPFGVTLAEEQWIYDLNLENQNDFIAIDAPLEKTINLDSPNINIAEQSELNIQGGGDLYAWEFIQGLGGSVDNLLPENANGAFAIIPGGSTYAPYDTQYWLGADNIQMGEQIYLAGSEGLAEGVYTILPARYALMPGARLVTPTDTNMLVSQQFTRIDGAAIVAGQRRTAGTGLYDSQYQGYVVESSDAVRSRSEYLESKASQFFRDAASRNDTVLPAMPEDAGVLNIIATNDLKLSGQLLGESAQVTYQEGNSEITTAGRGSLVNISGDNINIVHSADEIIDNNGVIELLDSNINNFTAASLLFGGTRQRTDEGVNIGVAATTVSMAEKAELNASDIYLVGDTVTVNNNASITATGEPGQLDTRINVDGDGALLRVSVADQISINRTNENANASTGVIDLKTGSTLTGSAIALDASARLINNGSLDVDNGSLNLGANRISLADNSDVSNVGLVMNYSDLESFNVNELVLTSRTSVDIYGGTEERKLALNNLKIESGIIDSYQQVQNPGTVDELIIQPELTLEVAETLTLSNPSLYSSNGTPTGSGSLTFKAKNIDLAEGDLQIRGFENVSLIADEQISVLGKGSLGTTAANGLILDASRITAGNTAEYIIDAGASQLTTRRSSTAVLAVNESLGDSLTMQAGSIVHQGNIEMASGELELRAVNDDIDLLSGSVINLSGIERDFAGEAVYTPGGGLALVADNGNVFQQAATSNNAALINVSGGNNQGNAGSIEVRAQNGDVDLQGTLLAAHGDSAKGGSFISDSDSINNIQSLNQKLNTGFNQRRHIRLRDGDLTIGSSDSIVAKDVLLQADEGYLTVAGDINASGSDGGKVHLAAKNTSAGVNDSLITVNANINASATDTNGDGGEVFIESRGDGLIDLVGGSINVAGNGEGKGGKIHIRAPRFSDDKGLNLKEVQTSLNGFSRMYIEGYRSYDSVSTIDVNKFASGGEYFDHADTFVTNASSSELLSELGLSSHSNVDNILLAPGIELNGTSDITLNADLDLLSSRFGDDNDIPGFLTIRAAADVNVNQSIQDGFIRESGRFGVDDDFNTLVFDRLQQGNSWSYTLIAGADDSAASSLSVLESGIFNLAIDKTVRTGTGDIRLVTGSDINFGTRSSMYTAGSATDRGSYDVDLGSGFTYMDYLILPGAEFPDQGGDLYITSGGTIEYNEGNRPESILVSDWLFRRGEESRDCTNCPASGFVATMWGINFREFKHGVGALGGGDVNIYAEGDINQLSVSVPTTGKQVGDVTIDGSSLGSNSSTYASNIVQQQGGGDISLTVGGNLNHSQLFAADGHIDVDVGKNIGNEAFDSGVFVISANTQSDIQAGGNIRLYGSNNFSLLPLSNQYFNKFRSYEDTSSNSRSLRASHFSTLSEDSAIKLTALTGNISLDNLSTSDYVGGSVSPFNSATLLEESDSTSLLGKIYTANFYAAALDGDIAVNNSFSLWPSSSGNLELLAQNNIIGDTEGAGSINMNMIALAPENLPSITNPSTSIRNDIPSGAVYEQADQLLHIDDFVPTRLIANKGDIKSTNSSGTFIFGTNKSAEIIAGRDILNFSLQGQNNRNTDVTILQAGRDFKHINSEASGSKGNFHGVELYGPGELQVLAGRNIDLGDQKGIIASGNNINTLFENESADLLVLSGLGEQGADTEAFINQYIATDDSIYAEKIQQFFAERGQSGLSKEAAVAQFIALDEKQQRSVVFSSFFNELTQSADRAAKEQNGLVSDGEILGYTRGLDAVGTLFPDTVLEKRVSVEGEVTDADKIITGGFAYTIPDENLTYSGNIFMVASTIQTQDNGGDILMMAPGGFLNVGLSVSDDETNDNETDKGILTKGDGSISILAHGDVAVNQSRIQALNGGAISIWSTKGDIDAGRGAKSALNIPPPRLVPDPVTGAIVQVFDAAVQGNGIRTACFDEGCSPGSVTLAAPAGVIDAGDAGINAGGNLILATDTVLNANQIEAGGDSTGVPADAGALGADLGGLDVNSAGEDAGSELVAQDASDQFGAGSVAILQVEVMGLSGEPEATPGSAGRSTTPATGKKEKDTEQNTGSVKPSKAAEPDLSMNLLH